MFPYVVFVFHYVVVMFPNVVFVFPYVVVVRHQYQGVGLQRLLVDPRQLSRVRYTILVPGLGVLYITTVFMSWAAVNVSTTVCGMWSKGAALEQP